MRVKIPDENASKEDESPAELGWAKRLKAIAQTGLTYAKDQYDIERYESVRQIAAEMMAAEFSGMSSANWLICSHPRLGTPLQRLTCAPRCFRTREYC